MATPIIAPPELITSMVRAPFNVQWEEVTPAQAAEYLKNMRTNRHPSKHHVGMLAREIKAGRWRNSPQGIAFGKDGQLCDGQHRVMAVVQAGVSVWMMVHRGVGEEVFPVLDTGKTRTFSDVLGAMYGLKHTAKLSSLVRVLHKLDLHPAREEKPSQEALIITLERYEARITELLKYVPGRGYPMTVWGPVLWVRPLMPVSIDAFSAQLSTGINCKEGDPVVALRRLFESRAPSSHTPENAMKYTMVALRAVIEGSKLKVVQMNHGIIEWMREKLDEKEATARRALAAKKTVKAVSK